MVKNLLAMQETWVRSLRPADPLEKGMATYSSAPGASLVARMVKNLPAMQETRIRSLGLGRSPGEGDGNPLQYSCLKNSMDRERSLASLSPWGCKELDTTEQLTHTHPGEV